MTFNPLFSSSGVSNNFLALHTEYIFCQHFNMLLYNESGCTFTDVFFCILLLVQSYFSVCFHQSTPSMLLSIFFLHAQYVGINICEEK